MIVVKVRDRDIKAAPMGPVTTGSVGLPVRWHFIGKEWEDLAKVAVFRVGNDGTEITVTVLEDMCLVPDELLVQANAGENLWIGVYGWKGTNANDTIIPEIAIPTTEAYVRIQDGSQPSGIEPPEGTPGWSAQIQNATDEALRVAHGVAADAAAGEFDGISPEVTIAEITHGHSVTITDRDHPAGQSFSVLDGDSAYEQAVAGGYEGTEAQFNEELASFKELSEQAADSAEDAAEVAPFYAEYGVTTKAAVVAAINGKRQIYARRLGGPGYLPYTDAFSYSDTSGNTKTGHRFSGTLGTTQWVYELKDSWNSYTNDLSAPADRAEAAATAADGSAKDSEAYAIGKRGGTDVGSSDPAYHNNSKYYAEQAGETVNTFTGTTVPAAVQTVNTAGQTQVGAVNTAGQTALTAVSGAQTAAVSAVQTESATQQAAIEQKGEDVLDSIPSDYTTLSGDVDDLKSAVNEEIDGVISAKQTFVVSAYDDHEMRINSGGINANGADTTNDTRCRTRYFDIVPSRRYIIKLRSADYVIINAFEYSTTSAGASVKQRISLTDDNTIIFNALDGVYFARICFAKADKTATITETDRDNILNALELYAIADPSLTEAGAPADAKVTGDRLTALESFASDTGVTVNGETVDIDPGTLTSGYVNTNTGGINSSSSGLGVTDFIDIHDYTKIAYLRLRSTSATATTGMCFYDSNEAWIGGIVSLKSQPVAGYDTQLTIADVPDGAYYARFTGYIDTATYGDFVVKGIKASIPNDIININRAPQIGNIFCVASTLPGADTFTDVIGLYDTLVENYPLIMSKNALTNGSFTNYEYVFSTGNYNTKGRRTRDAVIAKPKILITAGAHGAERSAVMSLYYFVKAMCENAYTLNDVINPVEYHIIPVVCPWAYDNNSRTNENGVNINRNFATSDWTQTATGDDYSGASAGDQVETQVVQNWLTANNDAEVYIDFHNSAFADEISALLGLSTQDHLKAKMCYLQSVNKIVPYLKNARNLGQYNIFAYTGNTDIPGTAKGYGEEQGIMSFTLETSNNVENHGKYGAFVNAIGCEMFGATIKAMVKYVLS